MQSGAIEPVTHMLGEEANQSLREAQCVTTECQFYVSTVKNASDHQNFKYVHARKWQTGTWHLDLSSTWVLLESHLQGFQFCLRLVTWALNLWNTIFCLCFHLQDIIVPAFMHLCWCRVIKCKWLYPRCLKIPQQSVVTRTHLLWLSQLKFVIYIFKNELISYQFRGTMTNK